MKRFKSSRYKKFTQENADYLCHEVQRMEESQQFMPPDLVEALRELVEVIIWSDKNAERVFDSFLERSMMSTFERVVTNADFPSVVKVQAIQCITLMLQNLTRKSSIYFVCSNNHLNRIISIELDENDDELLSIYVSFLKTLALRLNEDTVQFFFDRETGVFPLFERASKLLGARDGMVRAAARQIVISVAHLNDPAIITFLCDALHDIFVIVAGILWSQIERLAAASMRYATTIREDNVDSSPLPSLAVLGGHFEDVVDDFFYINDLFSLPHEFAPPILECVLDRMVITPLLNPLRVAAGQEIKPLTPIRTNTVISSSSSVSSVPASIAMCVLARWLRINRVDSLTTLLRSRLFPESEKGICNHSEAECGSRGVDACEDAGLVGAVVSRGDVANLTGAVLLLDVMESAGFFSTDAQNNPIPVTTSTTRVDSNPAASAAAAITRTPSQGSAASGSNLDDNHAVEGNGAETLVAALLPIEKTLCQCHEDVDFDTDIDAASLPPIEEWGCPSRGVFVRRATRGALAPSVTVATALYELATRAESTRLVIFHAALHLFLRRVGPPSARGPAIRSLVFVCLSAIRRVAVRWAADLAARDAVSQREWMRTAYDILFVRLEEAAHADTSAPLTAWPADALLRDAALLLPAAPPFPPAPLPVRGAQTRTEAELVALRMWLAVRAAAHDAAGAVDGLRRRLASAAAAHAAGETLVPPAPRCAMRCELVAERRHPPGPPTAAAGTAMQMALYDGEALLLDAAGGTAAEARRVLFAMQMIYTRAARSVAPFGVVLTYTHPTAPFHLHIVFRHRHAARAAVDTINELAAACRSRGAALAYCALNPCTPKAHGKGNGGNGNSIAIDDPTCNEN